MPIFDQGYQHWKGPLAGHAWRWLAIARHGVRVQLKNWLLRILLLLAWLPALALVVAVALWGLVEQKSAGVLSLVANLLPADILLDPRAYRSAAWTLAYSTFFRVEMFFIMLLVVLAGPSLISRDLRFNALPLYFARPLTRLDYFLGKLGVIAALVAAVAVGPAVFAYLIGVCFSLDLSVVKDTYPLLLGSIAYGLLITLSAGTFILALSSLSRRSLYVGIAWFGLWWISAAVAGILIEIRGESMRREVVERELTAWVQENPPPPGTQMMHGHVPAMHYDSETRRMKLTGVEPVHEEEARRWFEEWSQANAEAWSNALSTQGAATRNDWRPLCSYTANLQRLGEGLLNTDAAWVQIGGALERARQIVPPRMFGGPRRRGPPRPETINERRLADEFVLQYPWTWSAGVLAGLLGLSVWTLTFRVKSLDRLR
jgi:ABC-type transport system involved in multi-copper enzyme maturation permease subunit